MGAVQKLATVVIIGLVALATVLTVYIAREPDRRGGESTEQEDIAIVRGTELYIQYCLQCHGPSGLGAAGGDGRVGGVLNREEFYQSDDPAQQQLAADWAHFRIQYGVPPSPLETDKIMPAFGTELNGEEIDSLVYLILNADWDYVYNQAVLETGLTVAEAECEEDPESAVYCDNLEEAPPVYPTAPPQVIPEEESAGGGEEEAASGDAAVEIAAQDPYSWSQTEVTVQPGDTIAVVPASLQHDFTVDELGISEDLPPGGETVMVTIPDDAEPGDYEFYCSVPGHAESGMVGTVTIEGS